MTRAASRPPHVTREIDRVIHISKPDIGPAEEEAVLEVLRSGMLAMGRKTAEFESAWAEYCGVKTRGPDGERDGRQRGDPQVPGDRPR